MAKKVKTRKRTITSNKKTKKNESKISDLEINKCNDFCSTSYLQKFRTQFRKTFKTNPYLIKPKTDAEIDKLLKNVNMGDQINLCKKNFCTPNCKGLLNNKKARYVCPSCEKKFPKIKKEGAINYCSYDTNI